MTRKEAIEKMVSLNVLVQMTENVYMVNIESGALDFSQLGIVVYYHDMSVSITYEHITDIFVYDGKMVIEIDHMETALRIPIDY